MRLALAWRLNSELLWRAPWSALSSALFSAILILGGLVQQRVHTGFHARVFHIVSCFVLAFMLFAVGMYSFVMNSLMCRGMLTNLLLLIEGEARLVMETEASEMQPIQAQHSE